MGKFKKVLAIVASLCMMMMLIAGCGADKKAADGGDKAALKGGGSNIIYIITPSHSNPFFKTEADAAAAKAKALGYEVKMVSHDDDATKQSELFENAISDKAAAIICDNAGADATVAAVKKAIAEAFVEKMGEKGEYAELLGKESDTNAGVRSKAFHEVIDQYKDMKMVAQQTANWEQTEGFQKTETILQSNPNIKGIICGNDTMAVGAVAAVKNAGLQGKIAIIGVDGSDEAAAAIKAGDMTGTALQQAAKIAEMAVEQADKYLKTGSTGLDEKQLVDCIAITAKNVDKLKTFVYKE